MVFVLILLIFPVFEAKSLIIEKEGHSSGDFGSPLFLTPFIESGNLEEGRSLSLVKLPGMSNVTSYAGFFTVDETFNSNHFLWYFPTMSDNKKVPVLLWLNGGPGSSSLNGLFEENGPLAVENNRFILREHHWTANHHLFYIDNPVGAGFSFTNDSRGYCTHQTQIGEQLYTTLIQFFRLFPELQNNDFIVSGVSYAGKYIPVLAYTIHSKNPTAKIKINLKRVVVADGWCDPINQLKKSTLLYEIGLMDLNQKSVAEDLEKQTAEFIMQKEWIKAYNAMGTLLNYTSDSIGNISQFNFLESSSAETCSYCQLIRRANIRKAIHVGDKAFQDGKIAYEHLKEDIMQSVAPLISELLDYYAVLMYNGQLDIIVGYTSTVNYLRNLNFTGSEEYKNASRHKLIFDKDNDKELAGYIKCAGNLTEVMIRAAGHKVTKEKPLWAKRLISWFSSGGALKNCDNVRN